MRTFTTKAVRKQMATVSALPRPHPLPAQHRRWMTGSRRKLTGQLVIMAVLLVVGTLFVFPYWYMIVSSLRPPFYDFGLPDFDLWPAQPSLAAYQRLVDMPVSGVTRGLGQVGFVLNGIKNTMIQEIGIVLGSTITSLLAAYAFAKGNFDGKNFLFYLFLSTMMIPVEITLVPKLVMFTKWGFIGTHWTLIIPAVMGAGGWFLMRMFMSTVPNAYVDAARIDGANEFRILWDVIAPLCKSVITVHVLFTFLGVWNDLMGQVTYVNVRKNYTLTMVLYSIQKSYNSVYGQSHFGDDAGLFMQTYFSGLAIGTLPTFIVFILFQRYITEGTIITGLKM
jgi:multiple sugar transport system permease protein